MSGRQRVAVVALIGAAMAMGGLLVAFAAGACPVDTAEQPCPDYARNRVLVVALAASTTAIAVTPFAFLADFVAKRRIVYRGAWWRAVRRGALAGAVVTALGALRLGEVMSVPVVLFVLLLAIVVDRVMSSQGAQRRKG